jgi:uncharacterized protein YecE (DUF72 family)
MSGKIHIGVGGWTFPPWRGGAFYPPGLAQAKELHYASRHLTAIEINGTFYGSQKPETFRKWRDESPDGFVFSVKGSRFCTNRKVLAQAGEAITRFIGGGVTELGDKLGPLLWQFAGTKKYDPDDFPRFLDLLPQSHDGVPLRHVVEPRHHSFVLPEVITALRDRGIGVVLADDDTHPMLPDPTADFVYLRIQRGEDENPLAYPETELDVWTDRLKVWASGDTPADLPLIDGGHPPARTPRDVFCFIISGGKLHAPAGAQHMIAQLDR